MSDGGNSKTAGIVLLVAALVGVILIGVFSPTRNVASSPPRVDPPAASILPTSGDSAPAVAPVPDAEREHIASPFTNGGTDSVAALCEATIREQRREHGDDTLDVEIGERYGVRPPPGRGPDSLIVEGTAPGRDATPAVWHCAATMYPTGAVATLVAVLEDGWPGVAARFPAAYGVTLAAEDLCLQRTKPVFPEYVFRGVKHWRVADTLHVTGEAIPLNSGDLAGDFHCKAVVRYGRVLGAQAKAGE
ncbi:MAG: hypothetical protein ACJ79K_06850 [Gemmatimonadaceae bacterium]